MESGEDVSADTIDSSSNEEAHESEINQDSVNEAHELEINQDSANVSIHRNIDIVPGDVRRHDPILSSHLLGQLRLEPPQQVAQASHLDQQAQPF